MPAHPARRVIGVLRAINRVVAVICGLALLATVLLILLEVAMRHTAAGGFNGADEIAGYVMAGVASWGFSYALVERAHVRIDVLQLRLPARARALLDMLAMASFAAVSCLVTIYAWGVLADSVKSHSLANTVLATPLWIPQSVWFAAWLWLSIVSVILLICIVALAASGQWQAVRKTAGPATESSE